MLEEHVYSGRDNIIALALYVGSSLLTHTTLTRARLEIGDTVLDSDTPSQAGYFDLTNDDFIILKLGDAGLAAGGQIARLIVFDDVYTDGVVWGEFMLLVHD
jgi:hypothetical protein